MRILLDECVPRPLTADQNLRYQQNLQRFGVAILVLIAPSNRLADLVPLMPNARNLLQTISVGEVVEISENK